MLSGFFLLAFVAFAFSRCLPTPLGSLGLFLRVGTLLVGKLGLARSRLAGQSRSVGGTISSISSTVLM